MIHLKKPLVISVLIPLVTALPELPLHNAVGPQGRDLPAGVPACSNNDPSYSTVTSAWVNDDGQGFYAGLDCNSGGKGGQHCWFIILLKMKYL